MPSLSPKIKKEINNYKLQNRVWGLLPKKFKEIVGYIFLFLSFFTALPFVSTDWSNNFSHNYSSKNTTIKVEGTGNNVSVENYNLDNTEDKEKIQQEVKGVKLKTNFSQWENYEKFEESPYNNLGLCPLYSSVFEGRTMYSPYLVSTDFTKEFSIQPLSEYKSNIVFEFKSIFRCIIGNGNYKHIACEVYNNEYLPYSANYLVEENQQIRQPWISKYDGIKPKTNLFFKITSAPLENSEILNVDIEIKFIPKDSITGEYETSFFKYSIPTGQLADGIKRKIGIGLIDPDKIPDEVCAIFDSIK